MSNRDLVNNITISREVATNVLLNKHEINTVNALPKLNTDNPEDINRILIPALRTINAYPAGYDFLINVIGEVKRANKMNLFTPTPNREKPKWWIIKITQKTWKEYFMHASNFTQRQSLARQVFKDLSTGWIKTQQTKGVWEIETIAPPFRIMEQQTFANQATGEIDIYREIWLNHRVFGSLINGECYEKEKSQGYFLIPRNFFATITSIDLERKENYKTTKLTKGRKESYMSENEIEGNRLENPTRIIKSYNPFYRAQILGLMNNTTEKTSIRVPQEEFLKTALPEYVDKKGYLTVSIIDLQNAIKDSFNPVLERIPTGLLVKSIYLGNKGGDSILYFRKPTE